MDIDQLAFGKVAAGGAIVFELIEVLVDKDLLSLDDVRAVLDRARVAVAKNLKSEGASEATQIIAAILSDRFSAHSRAARTGSLPFMTVRAVCEGHSLTDGTRDFLAASLDRPADALPSARR